MEYLIKAVCTKCGREMKTTRNIFTKGHDPTPTLVTTEFKCVCGNVFVKALNLR